MAHSSIFQKLIGTPVLADNRTVKNEFSSDFLDMSVVKAD
jgi:hypothetical protein